MLLCSIGGMAQTVTVTTTDNVTKKYTYDEMSRKSFINAKKLKIEGTWDFAQFYDLHSYMWADTNYARVNLVEVDMSNLKSDEKNPILFASFLANCPVLKKVTFPASDVLVVSNDECFKNDSLLTTIINLDHVILKYGNLSQMFYGCKSLKTITFAAHNYGKEIKFSIDETFSGCTSLETINNFKYFDKYERIDYAFRNCQSLKTVELGGDISKITAPDGYDYLKGTFDGVPDECIKYLPTYTKAVPSQWLTYKNFGMPFMVSISGRIAGMVGDTYESASNFSFGVSPGYAYYDKSKIKINTYQFLSSPLLNSKPQDGTPVESNIDLSKKTLKALDYLYCLGVELTNGRDSYRSDVIRIQVDKDWIIRATFDPEDPYIPNMEWNRGYKFRKEGDYYYVTKSMLNTPKLSELQGGWLSRAKTITCQGDWTDEMLKRFAIALRGRLDQNLGRSPFAENISLYNVRINNELKLCRNKGKEVSYCTKEKLSFFDDKTEVYDAYPASYYSVHYDSLFYCPKYGMTKLKSVSLPENVCRDNQKPYSTNKGNLVDGYQLAVHTFMNSTFKGCTALTSVSGLDVDDRCYVDLAHAFDSCVSLKSLYLKHTPYYDCSIKSMESMFENCTSLYLAVLDGVTTFKNSFSDYNGSTKRVVDVSKSEEDCKERTYFTPITTYTSLVNTFKNCSTLVSVTIASDFRGGKYTDFTVIPDAQLKGSFDGADQCKKFVAGSVSAGVPNVWKEKYHNFAITDVTYSFLSNSRTKTISGQTGLLTSYLSNSYKLTVSPSYAYYQTSLKALDFEENVVYKNDELMPTWSDCKMEPVFSKYGVTSWREMCKYKPAGLITEALNNGYLVLDLTYLDNKKTDTLYIKCNTSTDKYITYVDGDKVVRVDTAKYGDPLPAPPTLKDRQDDNYYNMIFQGWSDTIKEAKQDMLIEAVWKYDYRIGICGVPVTSDNKDSLEFVRLDAGNRVIRYNNDCHIDFNPETKVLTIDGGYTLISLLSNDNACIASDINGLTIKVIGEVQLQSASDFGIITLYPLTITGEGKDKIRKDHFWVKNYHTLSSTEVPAAAITASMGLTIKDCWLEAEGSKGIQSSNIKISNAYVCAKAASTAATESQEAKLFSIVDCKTLELDGVRIKEPEKSYFSSTLGGITEDGKTLTKRYVEIVPIQPTHIVKYMNDGELVNVDLVYEDDYFKPWEMKNDTTDSYIKIFKGWDGDVSPDVTTDLTLNAQWSYQYKIRIAGEYVTSENCNDLTSITGVLKGSGDAYLRYDQASNTLYMKNITITTTDVTWGIMNQVKDLTLDISGYNTLYTPNCIALRSDKSMTIKGTLSDTLTVKNKAPEKGVSAYTAISLFNSSSLTVDNCAVVASGAAGMLGNLILRNAYFSVVSEGTTYNDNYKKVMYSLKNCSSLQLYSTKLIEPSDASYSESLGGITTNGTELTRSKVVFSPTSEFHTVTYMNGETVVRIDTFYQGEKVLKKEPTMSTTKEENGRFNIFSGWDQSVYGKTIAKDEVIKAKWTVGYDLIIEGVRVTEENRTNILAENDSFMNLWIQQQCESYDSFYCDKKRDAVVSYDPTTNVLSITVQENSWMYYAITSWDKNDAVFYNGIPDLTIRVNGNINLWGQFGPAFHTTAAVTIEGEGLEQTNILVTNQLQIEKAADLGELGDLNYAGILAEDKITFKNCSVVIQAPIGCDAKELELTNTSFTVTTEYNKPKLALQADKKHSLKCSALTLNNEEITEPSAAYFDADLKGITVDGVTLTQDTVVISVKETTTGNAEVASASGIYPNPANDYVTITNASADMTDEEITIYDALGRCVWFGKADNGVVNVSALDNGVYVLKTAGKNHELIIRR